MQSGEFNCTCPAYGYRLVKGEMTIDEAEAVTVRRIFSLYLQGLGTQAIANIFNDEVVPRRYGHSKWHSATIKYILTNERYSGQKKSIWRCISRLDFGKKYCHNSPSIR